MALRLFLKVILHFRCLCECLSRISDLLMCILFLKLKEDHQRNQGLEITYDWDAKQYVKRSEEVKVLRWNGREIRNGRNRISLHSALDYCR